MLFDIAPSEVLLTVGVAVVVIGPKDLPRALRTAGRWIGKMRRVSGHFRAGIETMIREAELEDMEKQWREQNAAIMAAHPEAHAQPDSAQAMTAADPAAPAALPPAALAPTVLVAPHEAPAAQASLPLPSTEPAPAGAPAAPHQAG